MADHHLTGICPVHRKVWILEMKFTNLQLMIVFHSVHFRVFLLVLDLIYLNSLLQRLSVTFILLAT